MSDYSDFENSLNNFSRILSNILQSNSYTLKTNLDNLMDYCENDEILTIITSRLKANRVIDVDNWYNEITSKPGRFELPKDSENRIALLYQLLVKIIKERIDPVDFASEIFPSRINQSDYYAREFIDNIISPFASGVEYLINEEVRERGLVPKKEPEKVIQTLEEKKLLDIKTLPDDFYMELQDQINKAFTNEIFPAVQILSRKFLENLIVDILRKKYSTRRIDLYFKTNRGRFQFFEILLKNLEENLDDFKGMPKPFDRKLVKKIDKYREQGNASAHTIELKLDKSDLIKDAKELEYIIKVLVKVLDSL